MRRAEQAVVERGLPPARERRRRSRSALKGLSGREALAVDQDAQPGLMGRPLGRLLRLGPGERVVGYSGRFGAVVSDGARQSVVDSTVPLRAPDASGELAPVDLDLRRTARGFAVGRSAVAVSLGEGADQTARVGEDGVAVRPLADAGGGAGQLVDGRVFWPNATTDTDVLAMASPGGLEVSYLLRSPDAPEQLDLGLELPAGASAERGWAQAGGVRVMRAGKPIAAISAPVAQDASGAPVNVAYAVQADRLVMRVDHRDQDVEYPIAVDPEITTDQLFDFGATREGWTENNVAGAWKYAWWDVGAGPGLSIWRDAFWPGDGAGQRGDFWHTTPGNSYISQISVYGVRWWLANSCIATFVQRYAGGAWPRMSDYFDCRSGGTQSSGFYGVGPMVSSETVADKYFVVLSMNTGYIGGQRGFTLGHWTGVSTRYGDRVAPQDAGGIFPNTWVDPDRADRDWQLGANDFGVGMKRIQYTSGWDPNTVQTETDPCTGAWDFYCNTNDMGPNLRGNYNPNGNQTLTRRHAGIPDGDWAIRANFIDLVGNQTGWRDVGRVKVDRQGPTATYEGGIAEREGQTLDGGVWDLVVDATDGVRGGSSGASRSGVDSVSFVLDGALQSVETNAKCTGDSCGVLADFSVDVSALDPGGHRLEVVMRDRAGNETRRSFSFSSSGGRTSEPMTTQSTTRGTTSVSCAGGPSFEVFYLGDTFDNLQVTYGIFDCGYRTSSSERRDVITYIYGECAPVASGDDGGSCLPPLQIDSAPICQRHENLYVQPDGSLESHAELSARGTTGAVFQDGNVIEIYTARTTIQISGSDPALVRRAADAARATPEPNIPRPGTAFESLPLLDPIGVAAPLLPQADPAAVPAKDVPC